MLKHSLADVITAALQSVLAIVQISC